MAGACKLIQDTGYKIQDTRYMIQDMGSKFGIQEKNAGS